MILHVFHSCLCSSEEVNYKKSIDQDTPKALKKIEPLAIAEERISSYSLSFLLYCWGL